MALGAVIGLAAHVDAGKTTLSESMLFLSGTVRRQGRVDHGDAFLDTEQMEKARGITIFSREARLTWKKTDLTLVPEDERTEEESALFSYHYTYENDKQYVTIFLMPWIPEKEVSEE